MAAPADLFATIWNRLESSAAEELAALAAQSSLEDWRDRKQEALALLGADGGGIAAVEKWAGSDLARLLASGQAIDHWYEPLAHDASHATPTALQLAKHKYISEHRLNDNVDLGSVILRRPLWGHWADALEPDPAEEVEPRDLFATLILLPGSIEAEDADTRGGTRLVALRFHRQAAGTVRALNSVGTWRVGFAPLVEEESELEIRLSLLPDGRPAYDPRAAQLDHRIEEVVKTLCEAGCHVIALPEMVLHPRSLKALKAAVLKHGPASDLALVLAGSYRRANSKRQPPANEAVVLDHLGREICRQHKLHRWNIHAERCVQLDLPPPGAGEWRYEYIEPGSEVIIVERLGLGRFAVLICEDHSRGQPGTWLRKHLLLDLQLVPVLDVHLEPHRWGAQSGRLASATGHTRVLVANSLPLTLRQNRVATKAGALQHVRAQCGIALATDIVDGVTRARILTVPLDSPEHTVILDWSPERWDEIAAVS